MTTATTSSWILFFLLIVVLLAFDLGVLNRKNHAPSIREAMVWSAMWISLALAFNVGVYFWFGSQKAVEFLTGFILEKSLSVDNLFVFILIFNAFRVPRYIHHKILFYGILGAIIFRFIFIFIGAALLSKFSWMMFVFGAFLVFTGIKITLKKDEEFNPDNNIVLKLATKYLPFRGEMSDMFIIKKDKKYFFTPLFIVLLAIETSDIIFAVDSIPAIFAITRDPFIVFTSNIFAILGLRSIYFVLENLMDKFIYLKYGLGVILTYIGIKMLIVEYIHIPVTLSLGFVFAVLLISILASLCRSPDTKSAK
ncbi:MAG: hypothetical protein A2381_09875 [Bdellovibrionales bacterium RIFOXYB1_FULL_37_110]|nr:MAG: hypothetical protein A2181_02955 [Bdellovibrionales bacterium RIFOXYA1_FULL_38_20]OFZ48900.1 MAG: hypothetical protein A2417_08335 [Bdellovibrionales bacterium RIFOXYC1_FULL_37_79]OFZ59577.1 MAG: hypothetical protein A2381_09875 [Bdellovibrionales bacterium RIFOXYB1_FULL_37_110]OFZ62444.1 MAG: hypothetical protein A2577_03380 [Bdellovibrionales bacterium RIFOXYD1_FULL_36_51]